MRFFHINEIWQWCAEREIALKDGARPADDSRFTHRRVVYASDDSSGREPEIAAKSVQGLGTWDECLLWVTLTGVWPSSEDWPAYYALRGSQGERRSLDVAPGHWFGAQEKDNLTLFLTLVLENAWDAYVLPASRGRNSEVRLQISHDEWMEMQSVQPVVAFNVP